MAIRDITEKARFCDVCERQIYSTHSHTTCTFCKRECCWACVICPDHEVLCRKCLRLPAVQSVFIEHDPIIKAANKARFEALKAATSGSGPV